MDVRANSVARRLGDELRHRGLTVAVAESCTGGLLGATITAVPGASSYMTGGVIAYANSVKQSLLGVSSEILREHGAVSEATAKAMAEGVRRLCQTDLGLAITGVAGPGAEGPKMAGLVHIALSGPGAAVTHRVHTEDRGRETNRYEAVVGALELAIGAITH